LISDEILGLPSHAAYFASWDGAGITKSNIMLFIPHRRLAVLACALVSSALSADELSLQRGKSELPKELPAALAKLMGEESYVVRGPDGVICEIWFAKQIPLKDGFKPTLQVKYAIQPGELVGVVRLPREGAAIDFRGQELPTGVFTLRYGHQPQDGNHLGTSDVSDFLLACALSEENDGAPIAKEKLFKMSAKAAGSSHPAIFLLLPPPAKAYGEASLKHDSEKEFWILQCDLPGKAKDAAQALPARLVVSGQSEG